MTRFLLSLLVICMACVNSACEEQILINDGYCVPFSVAQGESTELYLSGTDTFTKDITLTDFSGKEVLTLEVDLLPQIPQDDEPWAKGFGYTATATFQVPDDLPSGVYWWEGKVPFLVKKKGKAAKVLVVFESNTCNAYCRTGGKSFYGSDVPGDEMRAHKVSFERPLVIHPYNQEFLKWMIPRNERWEVGYVSDYDMDDPSVLEGVELLILPGHSEYWTRKARKNFDAHVDRGGDVLVLSGNTMWFQTRYEQAGNVVVCYKDKGLDSLCLPEERTVHYGYASLDYSIESSLGLNFEWAGYGRNEDKGWDGLKIVNPNSPLLKGTGLTATDTLFLSSGECDGFPFVGFNDAGQPIVDTARLDFYRYELIGYDFARRNDQDGLTGLVIYQKSPQSGIVINTGSNSWCHANNFKKHDGELLQQITTNMIELLLNKQEVFSEKALKR